MEQVPIFICRLFQISCINTLILPDPFTIFAACGFFSVFLVEKLSTAVKVLPVVLISSDDLLQDFQRSFCKPGFRFWTLDVINLDSVRSFFSSDRFLLEATHPGLWHVRVCYSGVGDGEGCLSGVLQWNSGTMYELQDGIVAGFAVAGQIANIYLSYFDSLAFCCNLVRNRFKFYVGTLPT